MLLRIPIPYQYTFDCRLSPVVDLVEKSLSFDVEQDVVDSNDSRQVLSLCLLQNLLARFPSATFWQATLHERSVVQSLLSSLHHAVRARSRPDLARDCLGLLILIGRTETGCDALVSLFPVFRENFIIDNLITQ